MAASTDELVEIILDIDWDKEPECESVWHETRPETHGGPVTHWMSVPCGHSGLRCAEKIRDIRRPGIAWVRCGRCGNRADARQVTFIEL